MSEDWYPFGIEEHRHPVYGSEFSLDHIFGPAERK